jgi:hypothetical protein
VVGLGVAAPLFAFGHPLITGPTAMVALLIAGISLEHRWSLGIRA